MPKKLRKMLGDVHSPSVVALRDLIDTQSKDTIRKWCLGYADAKILPIFEKHCSGDARPRNAINAACEYMDGKVKFPVVKNIILNECHTAARELGSNPVAQAAARAVGQGAAVAHTLTHSLGLYYYAAAAIAYDRVGVKASEDVYAAIAEEVCLDYTAALWAVAVEGEPNPAKLKWNCQGGTTMTRRELIDYCLTLAAVYEDYPFDETSTVMRHSGNKKMFALISERNGAVYINLKCEPMRADFLRRVFESVTPGWHMNKLHWNTVTMGGDVPAKDLYEMIQHSFNLTKPKGRKTE